MFHHTSCSSIAIFALASFLLVSGQTYAMSLGPSAKPKLQNTVLKSSLPKDIKPIQTVKIIKAGYKGKKKRSGSKISSLTRSLRKNKFSDIYFSKKTGMILEAEACKNNNRYFLQIGSDGEILQATKFDTCISPRIKKATKNSVLDQEANIPIIEEPALARPRVKKVIEPSPKKIKKKALILQEVLNLKGYNHIYSPRNKKLGVMACKNGVEYAFDVSNKAVSSWYQMLSKRKALGKCFGYGKQILNLNDLLKIMHRHGDTKIRVVQGKLPLFEAYSCLNGERRHVKINRWGNDNIRTVGKCS